MSSTPQRSRPQAFALIWAALATALVLTGFSRTFFLPLAAGKFHAPWFVYAHGALFLTWITLLCVQATLVLTRRGALHRRLGLVAVGLIPLMVVSAIVVASWATARDFRAGGGDAVISFYYGELIDVLMFAAFATAAVLCRRRPAFHRRLILFATLAILGAAVGRVPLLGAYVSFVTLGFTLALLAHDLLTVGRLHPVTVYGSLVFVIGAFTEDFVGGTQAWLRVGTILIQHVHYGLPSS